METKPEVNGETNLSDADLSEMSNETEMETHQEQTAKKKDEPSKSVSQNDMSPSLKNTSKPSPAKTIEIASDESTSKNVNARGDSEATSSSTTIVIVSEDDAKQNPQRRMSLRPRSIPKKYTDTTMCGEDDQKDPLGSSDPLEISPVKNSSSPPIQKSSVTVTTIKSPVKSLKPATKVMRPPPELIKAPVSKFPISSSTSVTVVPRTKANMPNSDTVVSVDSPSVLKPKTGTVVSSLPPSVTVSTIPPPKPVTKPVSLPPSSAAPMRKTSATTGNGSIKSTDPFESLGLSDDSFIVEAPSFVVPYLIEKCSEEEIKKLLERLKPPDVKDTKGHQSSDEDSSDSEGKATGEKPKSESSASEKTDKPTEANKRAKEDDDYFNGAIGRFFLDIGLSLVQEHVQGDLLRVQKRKVSKGSKISDPSLTVNALAKGLEITKAKNEPYRLPVSTCDRCNFKSESKLVMANHWSLPLALGSGSNLRYACHWCTFESKDSISVAEHIKTDHGLKSIGVSELAPHQCPLCQFEDVAKSKVTRHMMSCQKRFIPERNLEPPLDWEPPAKIPRMRGLRPYTSLANTGGLPLNTKGLHLPYHPLLPVSAHGTLFANAQTSLQGKAAKPALAPQMPAYPKMQPDAVGSILPRSFAGMGLNPALLSKANYRQNSSQAAAYAPFNASTNQVYQAIAKSFQAFQGQVSVSNSGGKHHPPASVSVAEKVKKNPAVNPVSMLSGVINTSGLTIQSAPSTTSNKARPNQQPSISITPLPRATPAVAANKHTLPSNPVIPVANSASPAAKNPPPASKPAQSGSAPAKGVVCEICDNSIKDLEQLRHHMQWIHKVKIHPKMIHNRPPLNCQKCQCRFFTDQGLERHLLGSHGLVTSSMQEAANRGQDGGRCPICGKIHQWKLLSHVVKDHGLSLKPAHLSYKCTVCTATFTMYKLFENHVYTAHSVVARKVLDKEKSENKRGGTSTSNTSASGVLRINDEITIIPQTARHDLTDQSVARLSRSDKRSRVDIIDLSDDEDHDGLSLPKSQVTITKVPAPKPPLNKSSKDSSSKRFKQDNPLE